MDRSNEAIFASIDEFRIEKLGKSARRRLAIIEATIKTLASYGAEGTTHDQVAIECGASRTLVRHYFPSREDLVRTSLRFILARFQHLCIGELSKYSDPAKQFEAYVITACSWMNYFPTDCRVWLLFYFYCGIDRDYRKMNSDLVAQGHVRITALLASMAGTRSVSRRQLEIRAKLIQNAITGCFICTATEDGSDVFKKGLVKATLRDCIRIARDRNAASKK